MCVPAFDYPKAQSEPAMGKSIHRNGKLFIPNWYCKTKKGKTDETNCWTHQAHKEGGWIYVCGLYYFFNLNNQQLIQYYALSHYQYIIINIIIIILSSSHHKHNMKHKTPYFTWKPKSQGKIHRSLYNSFPEITGRRKQPPYYNDFSSLAIIGRRIQHEGSYNSLVLWLQQEGGYNPLSLPCPATLIWR